MLSLGAKGEVRHKAFGLCADFPVSLRVQDNALAVDLPAGLQPPAFKLMQPFPGGTVTVSAPGNWATGKPLPGVDLAKAEAGWVLTVPREVHKVTLASR